MSSLHRVRVEKADGGQPLHTVETSDGLVVGGLTAGDLADYDRLKLAFALRGETLRLAAMEAIDDEAPPSWVRDKWYDALTAAVELPCEAGETEAETWLLLAVARSWNWIRLQAEEWRREQGPGAALVVLDDAGELRSLAWLRPPQLARRYPHVRLDDVPRSGHAVLIVCLPDGRQAQQSVSWDALRGQ